MCFSYCVFFCRYWMSFQYTACSSPSKCSFNASQILQVTLETKLQHSFLFSVFFEVFRSPVPTAKKLLAAANQCFDSVSWTRQAAICLSDFFLKKRLVWLAPPSIKQGFRNPNIPQHLCLSLLETNCYRIFVQSSKPTSSTILSFSFMTNFMIFHG